MTRTTWWLTAWSLGCGAGASPHENPAITVDSSHPTEGDDAAATVTPAHADESGATDEAVVVHQELDTPWCDRGPRDGRLLWNRVAGATHYEVDLVAATTCCDFEYRRWPEARWRAGRRLVVDEPSTPRARVTAT